MIWGILNDVGSGKTLFMAYLAYQSYLSGYKIYSNFKLNFPYFPITSLDSLKNIPLDDDKLILMDEAWLTLESREASTSDKKNILFSKFLLQARKKASDVIFSSQTSGQVDKRLRINVSIFIRPSITLSYNELLKQFTLTKPKPNTNIVPFMINIKFYDKYENSLNYDANFMVYPCHMLYDTNEIIEETRVVDFDKLELKYKQFVGTKSQLAAVLSRKERLSKRDAMSFADYMAGMKANEYLNEIKDKIRR